MSPPDGENPMLNETAPQQQPFEEETTEDAGPSGTPDQWWKKPTFITAAIVAAFLASIVGTIVVDQAARTTVPDLVGLTVDEATVLVEETGLALNGGASERDQFCKESRVADALCVVEEQTPAAGARVKDEAIIVRFVAGPTTVPDLVGASMAEAVDKLKASGLGTRIRDAEVRSIDGHLEWAVLTQSPGPNSKVTAGVSVKVTLDRPLVPAPNVVGLGASEAVQLISTAGLKSSALPSKSAGDEWLVVTATAPELTGELPVGTHIRLTLMSRMPNLAGMPLSEARTLLQNAGFTVVLAPGASTSMKVSTQSPSPGELAPDNAEVTLGTPPESVVFEVVGNGTRAMITWAPPRSFSIAQEGNAPLPWRREFVGIAPSAYERGNFSAQMQNGNSITCNMYVNGVLVESQTSTGTYAIAMCG